MQVWPCLRIYIRCLHICYANDISGLGHTLFTFDARRCGPPRLLPLHCVFFSSLAGSLMVTFFSKRWASSSRISMNSEDRIARQ